MVTIVRKFLAGLSAGVIEVSIVAYIKSLSGGMLDDMLPWEIVLARYGTAEARALIRISIRPPALLCASVVKFLFPGAKKPPGRRIHSRGLEANEQVSTTTRGEAGLPCRTACLRRRKTA